MCRVIGCGTWALSLLLFPPSRELNESQIAEKMRDMQKEPSWLARCAGERAGLNQGECLGTEWTTLEGWVGQS